MRNLLFECITFETGKTTVQHSVETTYGIYSTDLIDLSRKVLTFARIVWYGLFTDSTSQST